MWLNRMDCSIRSVCWQTEPRCAEDRSLFRFEKRSPAGIGWTWIMVVPKKSMDSNIQLLQEIKLVINKLFDGSQDITDKLTRVDAMPPANL